MDGAPQSVMSKVKDVGRRSVELFLHHTKFLLIFCGENVCGLYADYFFFLFSSVISQGTTIPYNSDKAAGSLSSMGWDAKRGKERGPVWLVVHKV